MAWNDRGRIRPEPKTKTDYWFSKYNRVLLWCYGEYQTLYGTVDGVDFQQGLPDLDNLDPREKHLIILDDLMDETDQRVASLFTKKSHHRNISVMYIAQNLFRRGKHHRTISLNAHYMVVFKNPRDVSQIMALDTDSRLGCDRLWLWSDCEYTVLLFVNTLTRWPVSLSAERPCYSFYISRKTKLILDRLRYITKYRRTLSVSPRERYDFLVSICPVSLVSYRSQCSRGVEQWLQCRLPKSISSFGDTFGWTVNKDCQTWII
jgi:hypothetical protein